MSQAYYVTSDPQILAKLDEIVAAHEARKAAYLEMIRSLGYEYGRAGYYLERKGSFYRKSPVTPERGSLPTYRQEQERKADILVNDKAHRLIGFDRQGEELYEEVSPRGNTKEGKALKKQLDELWDKLPPGLLGYLGQSHAWNFSNALVRAMGYQNDGVHTGRSLHFATLAHTHREEARFAVLQRPYEGDGGQPPEPGWGEEVTERVVNGTLKKMGYKVTD